MLPVHYKEISLHVDVNLLTWLCSASIYHFDLKGYSIYWIKWLNLKCHNNHPLIYINSITTYLHTMNPKYIVLRVKVTKFIYDIIGRFTFKNNFLRI